MHTLNTLITFVSENTFEAAIIGLLLLCLAVCLGAIVEIFMEQRLVYKDGFLFDEADLALDQRVRRALDR